MTTMQDAQKRLSAIHNMQDGGAKTEAALDLFNELDAADVVRLIDADPVTVDVIAKHTALRDWCVAMLPVYEAIPDNASEVCAHHDQRSERLGSITNNGSKEEVRAHIRLLLTEHDELMSGAGTTAPFRRLLARFDSDYQTVDRLRNGWIVARREAMTTVLAYRRWRWRRSHDLHLQTCGPSFDAGLPLPEEYKRWWSKISAGLHLVSSLDHHRRRLVAALSMLGVEVQSFPIGQHFGVMQRIADERIALQEAADEVQGVGRGRRRL